MSYILFVLFGNFIRILLYLKNLIEYYKDVSIIEVVI